MQRFDFRKIPVATLLVAFCLALLAPGCGSREDKPRWTTIPASSDDENQP